ncbi:hypothetical protein [Nocardia pseudovaccinii]|uniref:hypothetical protein n=1 Tax=Nocardia pseudovaccinii TaxID=189540 RepID=UPI0007A49243|nr:hypothetical protein [Nocardia pseudovaccinii]
MPVALLVAIVLVFGIPAAAWAWRTWRREGNLADQLTDSFWIWVLGSMATLGLSGLIRGSLPSSWAALAWSVLTLAGLAGFPVAAAVVEVRTLRQDNLRRAELGLVPRQALLPARLVRLLWSLALVAWPVAFVCAAYLIDRIWRPPAEDGGTGIAVLFGIVIGVELALAVGWVIHPKFIQPRRIRADEQRIRDADKKTLGITSVKPERPVGTAVAEQSALPSTAAAAPSRWRTAATVLMPTGLGVLVCFAGPALAGDEAGQHVGATPVWAVTALLTGIITSVLMAASDHLLKTGRSNAALNTMLATYMGVATVGMCLVLILL